MTDYKHLAVTPEIAEEIRNEDGRNDTERLKNWAEKNVEQDLEQKLKDYLNREMRNVAEAVIIENVVDDALV